MTSPHVLLESSQSSHAGGTLSSTQMFAYSLCFYNNNNNNNNNIYNIITERYIRHTPAEQLTGKGERGH